MTRDGAIIFADLIGKLPRTSSMRPISLGHQRSAKNLPPYCIHQSCTVDGAIIMVTIATIIAAWLLLSAVVALFLVTGALRSKPRNRASKAG
jgi:hypothetical protein